MNVKATTKTSLVLACILFWGCVSVAFSAPLGLVGHWPLDEDVNGVIADASGNGYDGNLIAGAGEIVESGLYGGALFCSGDINKTFAQVPNIVPEMKKGGFTVTLWFNRYGIGAHSSTAVVGAWGAADSENEWYNGHNFYAIVDGNGSLLLSNYTRTGTNYDVISEPNFYVDNEWTHLAVTNETTGGGWATLAGYINGEEVVSGTGHEFIGHDTGHLTFGSRTSNNRNLHNGLIDDVALFDRVLTADEIRSVMPGIDPKATPRDGKTDIAPDVVLTWPASESASAYDVYLGTVADDVNNAGPTVPAGVSVQRVETNSYTHNELLGLGQTYYWRVDEVNEVGTTAGPVLSFTVTESFVVDDMEMYPVVDFGDDNEDQAIWSTWIDGFGNEGNGALVGGFTGYPETKIVHAGKQSMQIYCGDAGASMSEVTAETVNLPSGIGSDWTQHPDLTGKLELYFYGAIGNTGQFYVKVNGIKKVYSGSISDLSWKPFLVDLTLLGTTLNDVKTLSIGLEGGQGLLFIDTIRLF